MHTWEIEAFLSLPGDWETSLFVLIKKEHCKKIFQSEKNSIYPEKSSSSSREGVKEESDSLSRTLPWECSVPQTVGAVSGAEVSSPRKAPPVRVEPELVLAKGYCQQLPSLYPDQHFKAHHFIGLVLKAEQSQNSERRHSSSPTGWIGLEILI